MNASVTNSNSMYHHASMSEEQLLLMSDYYLHGVFNPLIYTDELTFKREAWRYELASPDAPLDVTGIVYNEMKGFMTLDYVAHMNMLGSLYPGSVSANNSGGNPEDILTLTYEETLAFHQEYYHPSNATVFLYGDLNTEPFLKLIGSFFDEYGHKDIYVEKGPFVALTEPVTAVYQFPMESGATSVNSSVIQYAFNLGKQGPHTYIVFETLASILSVEASPLMQKIRQVLPAANISVYVSAQATGDVFVISASGVNESDMLPFKTAVDAAFADILANGLDPELTEAIIAAIEFSILSISDSGHVGISVATSLAVLGSMGFGLDFYNYYSTTLEIIRNHHTNGYFEDYIRQFITDNPHNVLVATVPAPGLREILDAELRASLDAKKAAKTTEEITAIIEMNARVAEMSATEPPAWMLESLNAVTVATLPVEVQTWDVAEKQIGGVRVLTTEAAVGGIGVTSINYNASAITVEELHYFNLFAGLLGRLPTQNYTLPQLQTSMARYLNGFGTRATMNEYYDFSFKPVFNVSWRGLNDDWPQAAALAQEIILRTDLSDANTIAGIVGRIRNSMRNSVNMNPLDTVINRMLAVNFDCMAYHDYMTGLAYYEFLGFALEKLESDPAEFIKNLETVRDKLIYQEGSAALFAGNAEGIKIFEDNLFILTGHLQGEAVNAADFSALPRPAGNEGVIIDSAVQYNFLLATYEEMGLGPDGNLGLLIPLTSIITDAHLMVEVRFNLGAYGVGIIPFRFGLVAYSFRDPAVTETFAAFDGMAAFAAASNLTQADIDRYIISAFSARTTPVGELSGAFSYMRNIYLGHPQNSGIYMLENIKSATPADLHNLAENLALMSQLGLRATAGGQSVILANAHLFDAIVYAFGEQDANAEPAALTRLEFLQLIFQTDQDVYDAAVSMGVILDTADPSDPLTREELAFVLIKASGIDFDAAYAAVIAGITDADDISEWAQAAVATALLFELLETDSEGRFNPKAVVTFADFMALMQ
jgi:hypothetical protein